MTDLNISDSSTDLFKIDKQKIIIQIKSINNNNNNFINSNASNSSHNPINLGQTSLNIINLSSEYLAFGTKTTKKKYYLVYPSYSVIHPNKTQKLEIAYYGKEGEIISDKGHKFKFEGFVIPEEKKDQDPRILFKTYISNKIPVKATLIKLDVILIENNINNNDNKNTNIGNPLSSKSLGFLSDKTEKSFIEDSLTSKENVMSSNIDKNRNLEKSKEKENHNEYGTPKIKRINNSNKRLTDYNYSIPKTEEENNALLNKLKVEYYKLKNELDILKNNYYNLRNHVDLEENNQEDIKEKNTKNYPSINSKEIKLSPSICVILFILGIILGFYLS